jgi:adenylate kinase
MEKVFYIFIGRSGSGKGTQSELLKSYLETECNIKDIAHITTGKSFRNFSMQDNYSAKKVKEMIDRGGLCPESFATWNLINLFVENIKENSTVLLDGSPRRIEEAHRLEETLDFYGYKNIVAIYIDVNKDWASDRLMTRGRADDMKTGIESRLSWFDSEVLPIVEYYKSNSKYNLLTINGMQSIEDVQKEILEKLK